ncbi:cell envelope integrity protein TolA [Halomonas sp.]|uniref:cell envelope integrity protein TolA n=1 Tax=Halomonas sp. TaxID=1486246 RepID=UPI00298DB18A|nr:cell envelope integrity protein TolA [Halomonas sp.]MDW7748613.1 cell envelope integrity protein TolA [Halomonas sp.]
MARHDRRVGYGLPLVLAVALHLAILAASVIRFPERETEPPSTNIVQATLVSTETTTDQAQRAEEARARAAARQAEEEAAAAAQEEEAREAEAEAVEAAEEAARRAEEAERQRQAEAEAREEARRAAEEEAARRAEQAEAEAERRRQAEAEAEAERQRQAEAEAERQRQRQAEAEAERQRQAEAEAEAERQRQAEAEAERQRQAEEQARRAAEAASQGLDRAIEGEADSVANARQANEAANSFINLVRRAVEQAWVIPPNVPEGASAEISVRLGPSGELFAATIGQSSGNSAFDRSAVQAVEAAAPFAELRDLPASAQRDYRQFNLRFRPGDIR